MNSKYEYFIAYASMLKPSDVKPVPVADEEKGKTYKEFPTYTEAAKAGHALMVQLGFNNYGVTRMLAP